MGNNNQVLADFQALLEQVYENNSNAMNEKIISKRKAKKRKKKLAQKNNQQTSTTVGNNEPEIIVPETDVIDVPTVVAELVDEEENAESSEEQTDNGNALVVYEEIEPEDSEELTPEFVALMQKFEQIGLEHDKEFNACKQAWSSAGDVPCPADIWNRLDQDYQKLKEETDNALSEADVEKFTANELQILDRFITAFNGYIEKLGQEIKAYKPDLIDKDDFNAPAKADSTEVAEVDDKSAEITTTDSTEVGNGEGSDTEAPSRTTNKNDKNKRKKENLLTYKFFLKTIKPIEDSLKGLNRGLEIIKRGLLNGVKALPGLVLEPASWLNDKLFAFLTSPIATDFIKTFAYSNPLTAMIFDGKFGNLGLDTPIKKIHDLTKKAIDGTKNLVKDTFEDKEKYDNRRFPKKDFNKLPLRQLEREYRSNKDVVNCINVSFNHTDVPLEYKAELHKYCLALDKAFQGKQITEVRNNLSKLFTTLNKICDAMNWAKPADWGNFVVKWTKVKGNTEQELAKIQKKAQSIDKEETEKLISDMSKMVAAFLQADEQLTDDAIKQKLLANPIRKFKQEELDSYYNKIAPRVREALPALTAEEDTIDTAEEEQEEVEQQAESLNQHLNKLEQLLETAEA